jgi:hypothetical protein
VRERNIEIISFENKFFFLSFSLDCKICKSGFNRDQLNDKLVYGFLTNISLIKFNEISKVYLQLENDSKLNQTIIICLSDELFLDEIQVLFNKIYIYLKIL